jgi:hypothetical protein
MVITRPLCSELLELGFVGDGDGLTTKGGCGDGTMTGNQQPERMRAGLGTSIVAQGVDFIHPAIAGKEASIGKEDVLVRVAQSFQHAGHGTLDELLETNPPAEDVLKAHLQDIDNALMKKAQLLAARQAAMMPPPPNGQGGPMANSNRESGAHNEPRGNGQGAQQQGPA